MSNTIEGVVINPDQPEKPKPSGLSNENALPIQEGKIVETIKEVTDPDEALNKIVADVLPMPEITMVPLKDNLDTFVPVSAKAQFEGTQMRPEQARRLDSTLSTAPSAPARRPKDSWK